MKCFHAIYWLTVIFAAFFNLKFYFIYKFNDFNWIQWPLFVFILATPLIGQLTKSYTITAFYLLASATSQAAVLIYASGALQAPGIFWVFAFPVAGGILLEKKGALWGTALLVLTFSFYIIAEYNWSIPNVVRDYGNYNTERIINVIGFSVFSIWNILNFLSNETESRFKIEKHRKEVEIIVNTITNEIGNPFKILTQDILKLKQIPHKPEAKNVIERIEKNIKGLSTLLLHIKSMRYKDNEIDTNVINLNDILTLSLESLSDLAKKKSIEILNLCDFRDCYILGNESILQNIILNHIITNALQFSPENEKVLIKGYCKSQYVTLEIQDFGKGMSKEMLNNIFNLNNRASNTTANKKETDLEMSLVKEYIEKMNGKIDITSLNQESGHRITGTLVTLRFPKIEKN